MDQGTPKPEPGMMERPDHGANRTELALMARGINSHKAYELKEAGHTVGSLQQLDKAALLKLGLQKDIIENLHGDGRPKIPEKNLIQALFNSRFTCCICHEPKRPVIVHHIREWASSRDHDLDNLAVLCDIHHNEAHTKRELSRNLTRGRIRKLKAMWEEEAKQFDANAILRMGRSVGVEYLYFNHHRLFNLARSLGIDLKELSGGRNIPGIHDADGNLVARATGTSWMYEGGDGNTLAYYVKRVLEAVIQNISAMNISDNLDRVYMNAVLQPDMFIIVSGAHYFSSNREITRGPGQTSTGYRKANGVKIAFTFDKWETTSNSAKYRWLTGRQDVSCIVRVVKMSHEEDGTLLIEGTVIAIAEGMPDLKKREYATVPFRPGFFRSRDDDKDLDESWLDVDDDEE